MNELVKEFLVNGINHVIIMVGDNAHTMPKSEYIKMCNEAREHRERQQRARHKREAMRKAV